MICKCGNEFEPMVFPTGKTQKVCGTCAFENMAKFFEEECPGDTLKEISDGEQIGAGIRKMINR